MSLIVKINVVKLGVTKTFKFEPSDRVEYVISQVQEKTAGTQPKPNENFGIFLKDPINEKKSFWLLNSRTLKFYDVESGTTLLYKDKNRYLKVKMLDKTIKTVLVDDSKSVGHALDIICEKIGLTNNDEFALFIEEEKTITEDDIAEEEKLKTNTIKRMSGAIMKSVDSIEQRKVDKIKEKAHTDDDTNWLANDKTLRESGVQDDTLVVIRRRFTFEQSVNITNPVEINLLYAQSRDAILDGSHPCDLNQASQFAAYMIQVQHGDFDDTRYKSGQIDPREYLPKEYQKNKEAVKKIKEEHRKISGLNELDGKYKYIQLCQNLKTYGVTFFCVKEVVSKKNKLQPCLFGVCKESVMKVDEKTKQVIKEWPLTTIKNWAASPNSFTLDFGNYTDGMYSVQTYEGAQIGQLIGGYIDIILKRMKKIHQKGYNDDELGVIAEDIVAPNRRNVVHHTKFKDNEVMMPKTRQVGAIKDELSAPQRTLIDNIDNSGRALLVIMDDLDEESENPYAELEPIRQARSDEFKVENVLASISVSLASISRASAVSPEELDYTALNDGISKITSNMTNLARYLKYNAKGLGGDTDGTELISAARNLSDTFKILLTRLDPQKEMTYEEAYDAMNQMADASISIESVLKKKAPDAILKGLVRGAEEIERATILLSDTARQIASTLDESSLNKITSAAKHVFLKSQGMVVASKVMAPYLHRPDATEQLSTSIRILSKDVKALASMCIVSTDDDDLRELVEKAAHNVSAELGTMLQLVQNGSVADILMVANEGLLNSIGNPYEMKELSTLFIQAYSRIAKGIQANVDVIETDDRDQLLEAAKNLNDVLKTEVQEDPIEILELIGEAAEANLEMDKILNNNPNTADLQSALLETVKEIYDATKSLEEEAINIAYLSDNQTAVKVRDAATRVILRSTALVTSAKVVAPYVESPEAVKQMVHAAKVLSQDIKNLTVLCNDATNDEQTKENIDDTARTIVEGLGRMLKLFQEGVIPEKIPELVLEVNDKFLKSIGEPETMRKQAIRFEKPYSRIVQGIPEKAKEMNEDDKNKLLDAAKELSDAMKVPLVTAAMPDDIFEKVEKMAGGNMGVENVLKENRAPIIMQKAMLQAAEKIEKAVTAFESQTKKVMDGADKETASKIAEANALAVQKGRGMVVGTKVVSPYVKMPEAVEQMNEYAKAFSKELLALRDLCQNATDSQDMKSLLHGAAEGVTNALNNFLKITQNIGKSPVNNVVEKDIFEVILDAQERLMVAHGRPDEMIRQATILGQVYSQLIRTMQAKSDLLVDSDEKENLLAAAAELSDATTELLAAAKRVKDNPKSKSEQDKLKSSAMHLRMVTNSTTNNALKKATAIKLESSARQASAAMTRLISIGRHAGPYNTDPVKQKEFDDMSDKLITQEGKHLMNSVKEDEQRQGSPQALLQLINASKAFVTSSILVVNLSKDNVRTIANQNEASILGQTAHTTEAIVNALSDAAEKASGDQEEFDRAVNTIQAKLNDLDQAMLASMSDNLKPKTNDSIKTLEERISNNCNKMREEVPDTVGYSHAEPEKTGSSVIKLANLVTPLSENLVAFAANLSSDPQTETLTLSRKVLDSTVDLVNASKLSCGLPEDISSGIQDAADKLLQSLKDLLSFVKATSNEIDAIDYLVSNFDNVKSEVDLRDGEMPQKGKSFVEYQDQMVKALKAITRDAHDMVAKGQGNPKELSGLCEDLYENYSTLVDETKFAIVLANKEVGEQLRGNVHALGDSCKSLVQSAGNFQACPNDYFANVDLSENAKDVSAKVAQIMSNLQKGSVGTQACINGISTLAGLLGDIDTTVMFAHAGTLDPEDEQSFGAHRETILWSSQKLVKDTKQLVEAAHGTQDQLAASVREVLKSNTSLIDSVKIGSASLGSEDMNGQILLLNAVKDVTSALSDLINQTKTTSGNPTDDTSNENLKSSAKHMVGTLTALLKTVRSVEDEASRGARALESTVEAIKQAVINYNVEDPSRRASPEDLIRATKGVTVATAKAVSAANSARQADIIEAANLGRKQCIELIDTAKAATVQTDSENVRTAIVVKVKDTAQAYCGVLEHVLTITTKAGEPGKERLTILSKKVAESVGDLVKEAEQLKGSDLVNPEDPNVIAENELLGAAAAIEAAARKLADLKPRERPREADESLNFEEQILEAAKSITSAAHALVKAATVAQRELVSTGKVCSPESDVYADTQWSQGLISAARMVAEATSALCEAANAAVLGNASQEKLVASAQAVSASTAQLLLACRVKADPNSKAQRGLQHAGTAVKRASDSLVKAAQEAAVFDTDEVDGYSPTKESKRGLFIDELNAQEAILKQEKALEKARKKLEAIRVLRYRKQQEQDDGKFLIDNED